MQVAHVEVFEQVFSIIKHYGFFHNGEGIDVGKLYFSLCIASIL